MKKRKMSRWFRTIHDLSLGFFINAVYSVTQGVYNLANFYVIFMSVILIILTNKGEK